jgi:phage portal protein BeeE
MDKKSDFVIPDGISPSDTTEVSKFQDEFIEKSEISRSRSLSYERRQRLPYLIEKGLSKPGTISFDILRRAATSVHAARICVNVLKEKVTKTKWAIQPIDPMAKVDEERIKQVENLFKHPNSNSETFRSFLDKILEDLLVLDAVSIEKTRYEDGTLAELHAVDSSTIRPVYDEHGNQDVMMELTNREGERNNVPVSYVQILDSNPYGGRESGVIAAAWPKKDFMYFCMHPQNNMGSFGYGLSPLESVVGVVANILNADNFNGTYFEEGAFPPVIIHLKQQMGQRELNAFREYFYNELEGRYHRPAIIGGEGDTEIINLKDLNQRDMQFMEYMKFMVQLLAAAYGLSGQDVGLTDDLGSKNVAETQKDLSQAKGYGSILSLLKEYFNEEIIWKDFGYTDLEFEWISPDTTDPAELADIIDKRLKNGTLLLNEARKMHGEEPFGDWADKPMILTGEGYKSVLAAEEPQQEEKQGKGFSFKVEKSIQTEDGKYQCLVSDLGYGQPFIFYDIISGDGYVIKPPVAVDLFSQKTEEKWSNILADKGLNVVRVNRMTEKEILKSLFPSEEVAKEFIKYQDMTPEYDSEKWKAKFGHSRKYPYYMVSKYIDGRVLSDPLLIEDMKRVPADYYKAIDQLANIWIAEKKYVLGDRRSNQVIIDKDKQIHAFDYQFVGNISRWKGTKDSYSTTLKQIPVLHERFNKAIDEGDKVSKNILDVILRKIRFGAIDDNQTDFQENPVLFGQMVRDDELKEKVKYLFNKQDSSLLTDKGFEEISYHYDFNSAAALLKKFVIDNSNGGGGILTMEDERGVVFHIFAKKNI